MQGLGLGIVQDESDQLEDFFSSRSMEEIDQWLRLRDKNQLRMVMEIWAKTITWSQYSLLQNPFSAMMTECLVGSRTKYIQGVNRAFYVKPAKPKDRVPIGKFSNRNERQFVYIEGPTALKSTNDAVYSARKYGPGALIARNRGRLVEMTEDEFFEYIAKSRKKKSNKE